MANRVCEVLGIEKPIIMGPANWLTNAELAGAVSKAGGLGVLGFSAGQTEPVFTIEETIANMRAEVRKVREITKNPLGINIAMSALSPDLNAFNGPMLQLMKEEGVEVAVTGGDVTPEWIDQFKGAGIKVVFRAQAPNAQNTRDAVAAGVDVIVATGFDEGGTVPPQAIGTFSMLPLIVDAAEGKVPVVAAGGIVDERTARAAFVLGAEGLYVGTAFLLSKESPIADNIKQMAIKADANDLIMYRTVPAYYRSLPGELPNKLLEMSNAGATEEEIYEAQHRYIGMRDGMLFGDLSKGYASFGCGISFIHAVEPVQTIIDRMMKGVTM